MSIITELSKIKTYPIVFSRELAKGKPIKDRSYFLEANREPSYTLINTNMTVQHIHELAIKKMNVGESNIEIGCWNSDGSILILKEDGSNLSQFIENIAGHCCFMQNYFKSLGEVGKWHDADGETAALVMIKIRKSFTFKA